MNNRKYPLIRYIYQYKKLNISILISTSVIILVVVFFLMPLEYTSRVSILPSAVAFTQGLSGNLGNLSKLAGLNLGGNTIQSQEMYKGIILSRRLLIPVIDTVYTIKTTEDATKKSLINYLEIEAKNEREIYEKALKLMRENILTINIDAENDILYLDVTTENPFLSAEIANKIVSVLNGIVKSEVQKEFRQKLEYIQRRLFNFEDSLKIYEKDYRIFLETNPDPTLPSFQIKQLQLQRNIRLQTELLIEFRKQLEIFIADNAINMADVKVLDHAYPPYRKSRPKRSLLVIAFLGLVLFIQIGFNASILIYRNLKKDIIETSSGRD